MPTYAYLCSLCSHEFDEMQKITAPPLTECPKCEKSSLKRKPTGGIGLSFAGSGFYKTDYAPNAQAPTAARAPTATGGACCPCGKNKGNCSS